MLRLDHTGKDGGVGQRGTSHKAADVDVVLALTTKEGELKVRCTHTRVPWVPRDVVLRRQEEPMLKHILAESEPVFSGKIVAIADQLDELEVPIEASKRQAMKALRGSGVGRRDADVLAALSMRRERIPDTGNHA